jgi:MFS family permease
MTTPQFDRRQWFAAHWFQFFNAVNFQIVMGAPIIVYAKSLGASSTVLGIIASFTPLMTVFQLPAAQHLERYGYKRFVIAGWGTRTIFIFALALVPIMAFLDNVSKMAAMMSALFMVNLVRGISSAGWMPWMTALIPEQVRGRFLSVDQFFMYAGCLISLVVSAIVMTGHVDPWEYSLVFLISAVAGTVSLFFIKQVPDVPPGEATRKSSQPVPWAAMLKYRPFLTLIIFNLIFVIVVGSLGVFTVEFLREESHFEVSTVLYLSAFSFVGALVMLPFTGRWVDQSGSKPLLRVATAMFGASIATWCLIAAGVIPGHHWVIALLNFFTGAASANFHLASVRITMATMPEMGRNHFFALFTVITSLGLGAAPVAWGVTLDMIGTYEAVTGVFHWKRHSMYFLALFVINTIAFAYISRLHESPGAGRAEPSLIYARLKRASRFWHR